MAVNVSDPSTLALLLIGAVLFGLGLIGFVSRTRATLAALCWGTMILGAVVTMHAGSPRSETDRATFAVAAVVIALVEGGLLFAIAGRSATPVADPEIHSADKETPHE